ncbi:MULTISPECIES: hypothetical protein [Chryseobacterium]|uniref:Uncharacterized protein n=1 Tax=Chryseobacterium camelliae TaxID=1265445 RepID=A0ABU0TH37_9FLAO|nr:MULTISPECIES: hypothetical protein [Chryseobacterium]MDT3405821.1 hypothetical protein [Pseudacidovorax intermedius]MDQ1096373.1 hypothetical protein [Chryseobacterium camelliae]MDQ1100312.1 hypothetical protein [Chryseobacterium sp. SORGH_AS_1048]MDR6087655.1 hypothetical protein [Chryseobacterium sp. SORGH_AS_0909]MDR6132029.1 hypothetical protein [Chryseobacterium sp. SORGH_AS_1175]
MKNGEQADVRIIEVNPDLVTYKEIDNTDGPLHSIHKSDIYQIIYQNGKTDVFGKYANAEEARRFIGNAINEFGIDRDYDWQGLRAEFEGGRVKINSINKKGRVVDEGDFWDLDKVIKFHKISLRSNNICYLNIVTTRFRGSKSEVDKLVIKMTDYQAAEGVLNAMKDLQLMHKD